MKIVNKHARRDYTILDTVEAGIALRGHEVKSIRAGRISLNEAFVKITGSQVYLVNSLIEIYPYARPEGYDPRRSRKLLLHKSQISVLKTKLQQGNYALIPLSLYTKDNLFKLEIGLGKGKKEYEKRELLRRRDIKRELERDFRGKVRT